MGTKGRLGFFLAAFSAVSWVPLAFAQEFRRGDANVDGRVDMADVDCIVVRSFTACGERCRSATDADGNGSINLTDAVRILQWHFLGQPETPSPGPFECGTAGDPGPGCDDYPPALCADPPSPPLDPRFELRIEAPAAIRGPSGGVALVEALVQLCNDDLVPYWSLGVVGEGCEIVSATTDGTQAAPQGQGGFFTQGFARTETIDPSRNGGRKGAVSAIFLTVVDLADLPPTGSGTACQTPNAVLKLTVSARVPEDGSGSCVLSFIDGLVGSGQPTENLVGRRPLGTLIAKPILTGATISVEQGTPPFLRGDASGDGETTISDAVRILQVLFTGEAVLACGDAADADDSGDLDIVDPVRLLGHLFLGQVEIPPPADACGADPTEDALDCGAYACP